ncbi:sulfite exporter TauE/SafE family protein [Arthrobacter sp. H20]|uniref:sulfite exporter TauE/SafE family protein n=1 Tax=Arthrobacter sp. H20 TaxID=1267981 RepID=UPI0020A6AB2A|nr:sulfite exporter TauE/SafE family protein [Arthrobacter sp. H20]
MTESFSMDQTMVVAAFGVGIVVGLTGMGGGALMTPILVLFFNVPPLTAVSSDLMASAVMKPVGSAVHLRRGTVNLQLVKWLAIGSIPSAFCGVLILKALGDEQSVQAGIKLALGIALMVTAILLVVRAYMRLVERARTRSGIGPKLPQGRPEVTPRVMPTLLLGAAGGLIVGLTSVGSGSIVIIGLMMIYPGLKASQLVGTDLLQAVPMVAAAAVGHMLFGSLDLGIALPLIVGSIPGVYIGAQMSSRLSGGFVRRALAFVLLASALKMLGVDNVTTGVILVAALLLAPVLWMYLRRRYGFPALAYTEKRQSAQARKLADAPAASNDSGQGNER